MRAQVIPRRPNAFTGRAINLIGVGNDTRAEYARLTTAVLIGRLIAVALGCSGVIALAVVVGWA